MNKIINSTSKKTNLYVRRQSKRVDLSNLKNTARVAGQNLFKLQSARSAKEIISQAIGENCKINKDWQDLGNGWEAIKTFFSRPAKHYIYSKPIDEKTYERGHISCHYDKNNNLEKFFVFDWNTKSLRKFGPDGNLLLKYTPEETHALFQYKSDSKNIHKMLREGKSVKNSVDIIESINALSQIFKKGKTNKAKEQTIGYRALDKVSLKKILSMPKDGMIFTDPSFMSITTKKGSLLPFLNFRNFNHIMQITIPEDTPYLKIDDLCHIIYPQKSENEWILEAGSKLLIKSRKGKIIAELIR